MKKHSKYQCPCCNFYTIDEKRAFNVCPVCFWEDDPSQYRDIYLKEGANKISLLKARENFLSFGACSEEFITFVRKPLKEET